MSGRPAPKVDVRSADFAARFVNERVDLHQDMIAEANAIAVGVYSVVLFFLDFAIARPEYLMPLHLTRLGLLTAALLFYPLRARWPRVGRLWVAVLSLALNGVFAWFLFDTLSGHAPERAAIPAIAFVGQAVFLIAASPYQTRGTLIMSALQFGLCFLACTADLHANYRYLLVVGVVIACANVYHRTLISWTVVAARFELASRLKIAPHDLVRRSLGNNSMLAASLKPHLRWCICLASDWRGYQALSRERSPEELATALEDYYDVARELLDEHFPTGNFYSDWIADELLIFFLTDKDPPDDALAAQVLAFARALLAAKARFSARTGLPRAIDIGIASGLSMVGLSGPASNRKVMAIGDVPVRARRMQAMGKLLRRGRGECDRIIYSDALFAEAGTPAAGQLVPDATDVHRSLAGETLLFEDGATDRAA